MTIEEQHKSFDKIAAKMQAIMFKKGNDYAGDQDRLSNFKKVGLATEVSPEQACLQMIATKVVRLSVLLKKEGEPDNESIEDSVIDMLNYSMLLHMLLDERKQGEK